MRTKKSIFIEVLLVIGLVAAISGMGFYNLTSARRAKNEKHARIMLLVMQKGQENFQAEKHNNRDDDEVGEFAALPELIGIKEATTYRIFDIYTMMNVPDKQRPVLRYLRTALQIPETTKKKKKPKTREDLEKEEKKVATPKKTKRTDPPKYLYNTPQNLFNQQTQEMVFDGYVYRVLLPQLTLTRKDMTEDEKVEAKTDEVEKFWCAFAWPERYGKDGTKSFFIDQNGKLYHREDPAFSGRGQTNLRAIDAYKGRAYESPVNEEVWQQWVEVKPKPKKEEKKDETKEGEEGKEGEVKEGEEGEEGKASERPKEKKETAPSPKPGKRKKLTDEEMEQRKKLLDETLKEGIELNPEE